MLEILRKYYFECLAVILCFSFITRIIHITYPDSYMFDEVYHAITAKLIARDDPRAYEWWNEPVETNTAVDWLHPPLAKYTQALGISIFGENVLGWRISSVIFGVLVIAAVARLTEILFKDKALSIMAAFLASLDGLLLVQSRIAMNDIHVTFFILLTLIVYAQHRDNKPNSQKFTRLSPFFILTGLCAGLAMGSKWSGVYVLLPIFIFEAIYFFQFVLKSTIKEKIIFVLQRFIFLVLLPITVYLFSYTHMFLQGKTLICTRATQIQGECYYEEFKDVSGERIIWKGYVSHFVELHRQIWWYQTNLEAEHPYQSRPLEWFLNLKPVWYFVEYNDDTRADIYALGNSALFWIGDLILIILSGSLIMRFISNVKNKSAHADWSNTQLTLFFLCVCYVSVWLPWQLSPRIMFFYHYTPAVPFLCIITAYGVHQLLKLNTKLSKTVAYSSLSMIILCFILFYPHWTGVQISTRFKDLVYFSIPSWK